MEVQRRHIIELNLGWDFEKMCHKKTMVGPLSLRAVRRDGMWTQDGRENKEKIKSQAIREHKGCGLVACPQGVWI